MLKTVLAVLAAAVCGFAALTWWALEAGEVAVLATRQADGTTRTTHVWYVVQDGELWIEAGSADNGWFRDVQLHPSPARP